MLDYLRHSSDSDPADWVIPGMDLEVCVNRKLYVLFFSFLTILIMKQCKISMTRQIAVAAIPWARTVKRGVVVSV
jgi:hypothetical protein